MYNVISDYFAMGGYGLYIWPCYLAFFATIIVLLVSAKSKYNKVRTSLQKSNESKT